MRIQADIRAHLWEVARAIADQQTCLAAPAVANHDQLFRVCRRLGDGCVACVGGTVGAHGAIAVPFAGGSHWLADGCDGRRVGGLGALLATQIVVVLRRRRRHGGGCDVMWVQAVFASSVVVRRRMAVSIWAASLVLGWLAIVSGQAI